jgi:hypothetical protein
MWRAFKEVSKDKLLPVSSKISNSHRTIEFTPVEPPPLLRRVILLKCGGEKNTSTTS